MKWNAFYASYFRHVDISSKVNVSSSMVNSLKSCNVYLLKMLTTFDEFDKLLYLGQTV